MREIKFRVWDTKNRYFLESTIAGKHPFHFIAGGTDYEITPSHPDYIFQQFTGLKDKNGIEIYEGDILEATRKDGHSIRKGQKYFIRFNNKMLTYDLIMVGDLERFKEFLEKDDTFFDNDGQVYLTQPKTKALVVIGNIYENKDLLTK